MFNKKKIVVVISVLGLISCVDSDESSNDNYINSIPLISSSPVISSSMFYPGDTANLTFSFYSKPSSFEFSFEGDEADNLFPHIYEPTNNEINVSAIVGCGRNSEIVYPKITIYSAPDENGDRVGPLTKITYYLDVGLSKENYTIEYYSDIESIEKKVTDIKIPLVRFEQTASADSKSDLIIELNGINKNRINSTEFVSISYNILNIGDRAASLPSITAWENLSAPDNNASFDGSHTYPSFVDTCLRPTDIITQERRAAFKSDSGNAYLMIDSDKAIDESDESNNFSMPFSW